MEDLGVGRVELLRLVVLWGKGRRRRRGQKKGSFFLCSRQEKEKKKKLTFSVIESIIVMKDFIRSCVALSWPWSSIPDWAIPGSIPRSWVICFWFLDYFFLAKVEFFFPLWRSNLGPENKKKKNFTTHRPELLQVGQLVAHRPEREVALGDRVHEGLLVLAVGGDLGHAVDEPVSFF